MKDKHLLKTNNLHEVKHWVEPGEQIRNQEQKGGLNIFMLMMLKRESVTQCPQGWWIMGGGTRRRPRSMDTRVVAASVL